MLSVLKERLDLIASDSSIHCVILAAKGDAFCAGHDLREMQQNQNIVFLPELI
ncbi:enoyl-CoA hydratase/isomerase family protein [Pseudomonas sp. BF-R-01]|jgi:enoyl-CoA hydratase/carnithine racemase|uniref:enoyl-CoA hydratase/isomerase family protein n=1 Tax=unclassified Pseudomonas TaxID=196821 RepID=UPI003989FE2D